MLEAFLTDLAAVLGFKTLSLDENGACLIELEGVSLLFELDEQIVPHRVLLSSEMLDFPSERRVEVFEACLEANCQLEESLSVIPDADRVFFHRWIAQGTERGELEQLINLFTTGFLEQKKRLDELLRSPSKRLSIPPSPSNS